MPALTGFQKRYLRSLGHPLQPVVMVGKAGLSPAVLAKVRRELDAHELIKIRFSDFKRERMQLTAQIAAECNSQIVGSVGNTALLFRAHPDAARQRIRVPQRPTGEPR